MVKKSMALVLDSCVDLPTEYVQHDFVRVIPLNITFKSGSTIQDGIDITTEQFYKKMSQEKKLPVTSQPSPEQFYTVYEQLLKQYKTVVSFHLASALSGTYNSAMLAKQMVAEKDQHRIILIDSKAVSLVEGFMAIEIIKCIKSKKSLEHIQSVVVELQKKYTCLIIPDTLENLKKGGRISHLGALLGGLLQIKPILIVGNKKDGYMDIYTKARGKKKAFATMLNTAKNDAFNIENQTIGVVHSCVDNNEELNEKLNIVKKELNPKEIIVSLVGATVGTHLGLNGFGIIYKE
ncbi:DegV family protein [Clostridium sp. 'deep sea']|uniref:DegV family protein n=1 Tax=Clostridium sp. 'deep sea' TaxID=2779445 RepID=UPI001896739D|nr:DegV family protein [Clostridium sp. 'deep sea']QOR33900.1 DegV family protein [Clostridium sp. 'deep sea']